VRANSANALTQLALLRHVAEDNRVQPDEFTLFWEDDAVLSPPAAGLSTARLRALLRESMGFARAHGYNMVAFGIMYFLHAPPNCTRLDQQPRVHEASWHECRGDMRSAVAYSVSRARARQIVSAWDTLTHGSSSMCAAKLWGGEQCTKDPYIMSTYLDTCRRKQPKLRCRALVVGYDWDDAADDEYQKWTAAAQRGKVRASKQRGVFVQNQACFGSHISTVRNLSTEKLCVRATKVRRATELRPPLGMGEP
jgi:hypothetical protein